MGKPNRTGPAVVPTQKYPRKLQPSIDSVHGSRCICRRCQPNGTEQRKTRAGEVVGITKFVPYGGRILVERS